MTSRCGVLSLLGLCEKDCSINMLNFNKLRFIVYEIFDNSQLFLTDPRISLSPGLRSASVDPQHLCLLCVYLEADLRFHREHSTYNNMNTDDDTIKVLGFLFDIIIEALRERFSNR